MRLCDSTFLITGGASGLGAGCVRHFAGHGANVVLADVNQQAGEQLAAELGSQVHYAQTDVTDTHHVQRAIEVATRRWGGLQVVIHCAGILGGTRVVTRDGPHPLEAFARVIEINLVGTFNVVRLAAAAMAPQAVDEEGQRGVIITTASIAAYEGQIGQAAYSASKGGVAAMTLPVARELAQHGIRVVAIAPGAFDTPMMQAVPDHLRQPLLQQIPFPQRLGRPAEFAALAQHVVENTMLNGTILRLDGALRMPAR